MIQVKTTFNKGAILAAVGRGEARICHRFGGYVRTVARNSIKRATSKRSKSRPGDPPIGHKNQLYRNFIFYDYSKTEHRVVIGSQLLSGTRGDIAPEKVEYGGAETIFVGNKNNLRKARAFYLPRPAMRMAFHAAMARLPTFISGSVH